jgi:hypothetical protein
MERSRGWRGGAVLVALGAGAAILGLQLYTSRVKPAISERWSDLSAAEREARNRANAAAMKAKQDDATYRAKLIARGEDPEMSPELHRDNPRRLREIANKKAQELADRMAAAQRMRQSSPEAIAAEKELADKRAARVAMVQHPDGDIVRLTPAEDAVAVARIKRAFGGATPFTPLGSLLRERHPWFVRFQNLDYLGDEGMKAVLSQSHPKSHFAIVHTMTTIETGLVRPSIAVWVKGTDGANKIVFVSGFANRKNTRFIAVGMKDGKEIGRQTLRRITGPRQAYVIDDMPFTALMIYGDSVAEANMLYALEASPALTGRSTFFAAY